MSLFDMFSSLIGFFLNLILKPLTPAIDYVFERLVIVVTSPLAVKRLSNLLFSILDRATSEDHREETFKRVDKLVCLIPCYLNRCEARPCLQKLGPALFTIPPLIFADPNATLDKAGELLDFSVEYINSTINFVTGTAQGTALVVKFLCAIQGVIENLSTTSSVQFLSGSNPLLTILQIILTPDKLVPGFIFQNVANSADLKKQLCAMLQSPCHKDLSDSVLCMLKLAYEKHYDSTIDYDGDGVVGTPADKALYMAAFGDGSGVYTAFTNAVCNITTDGSAQPLSVLNFVAFMTGNIKTAPTSTPPTPGAPFVPVITFA